MNFSGAPIVPMPRHQLLRDQIDCITFSEPQFLNFRSIMVFVVRDAQVLILCADLKGYENSDSDNYYENAEESQRFDSQ